MAKSKDGDGEADEGFSSLEESKTAINQKITFLEYEK